MSHVMCMHRYDCMTMVPLMGSTLSLTMSLTLSSALDSRVRAAQRHSCMQSRSPGATCHTLTVLCRYEITQSVCSRLSPVVSCTSPRSKRSDTRARPCEASVVRRDCLARLKRLTPRKLKNESSCWTVAAAAAAAARVGIVTTNGDSRLCRGCWPCASRVQLRANLVQRPLGNLYGFHR